MARQNINIGSSANDGTGDPLRTAFDKINDNFIELYGTDGDSNTLANNLDVNGHNIISSRSNEDIRILPAGTGGVIASAVRIAGTTISSDDSTQITIAENVQATGTLNVSGAATIDGALSSGTSLTLATGATVTGIDNGTLATGSATLLATQGAIKTYVDSQVTAQDLDFSTDDSTALSIDLDSESLQFSGGNGINTSGSDNTVTIAVDTGTVATLTDTQVLTNKTLTAPTINGATMTGNITVDNITLNDNIISSASNADLILDPSGTGDIKLTATSTDITGNASVSGTLSTADITTTGNQTISGSLTTGTLNIGDLNIDAQGRITTDTNGDVDIDPSGTGAINLTGPTNITGTATVTGQLNADNLRMDGNTLSSTTGGVTITAQPGQNVEVGGNNVKLTATEANFTLMEATTLRADTIQNDTSDGDISISTQGTGNINVNSIKIINLADPTSAQDAATKAYVDSVGGGGGSSSFTFVGDDSTGTVVSSGETFKIAGTQNVTTAVSGDTLTVTGPDLTSYVTASSSTTFTNKTFDVEGTGNSISNIDVADFKAAAIVTESEGIGSNDNDTTLPTSAAVKDYVDTEVSGVSGASTGDITFTGSTIQSPSNADITLDPSGTGDIIFNVEKIQLGSGASAGTKGIAIGRNAGRGQQYNIAIGDDAGGASVGTSGSVAIGQVAGNSSQGDEAVAIGYSAGRNSQGTQGIAIGYSAGQDSQGNYSIALGTDAGETSQGVQAVGIGFQAHYTGAGNHSVAIGNSAGRTSQGANSIAIGRLAGNVNQPAQSIVLNAQNNVSLHGTETDAFYVAPIRAVSGTSILNYNSSTKEITANDQLQTSGNTISTTSSNANLELEANGTGGIQVNSKLILDVSQSDGSSVTIDATKPVAILAGNTGAGDLEYTLADGTVAGQTIMLVRGNDPDGNSRESIHVIFGKFNDDGTITTNTNKEIFSQYQSVVTCIWNGSAWCTDRHL